MRIVILLLFLILSCGRGREENAVVLRFTGVVDVPYFSEVRVRVSGPDFDPIETSKEGPFYPGDLVSFDIEIPPGEERLFEALVFDPSGNPVYYGSELENTPAGEVVINLYPTPAVVSSVEKFADGGVPEENVEFYLLSGDLLSVNLRDSTGGQGSKESYLAGRYIGYERSPGEWVLMFVEKPSDTTLEISKIYEFEVRLPPDEEILLLSGSCEGYVVDGETVSVSSEKLRKGGFALLSGIGRAVYLNTSAESPVEFSEESCRTGEEQDCLPLSVVFTDSSPSGYEVYASEGGIEFRTDREGMFWKLEGPSYLLRVYGDLKTEGGCFGGWTLKVSLGEEFDGNAEVSIKEKSLLLKLLDNSVIRVFSEELQLSAFCPGSSEVSLRIPYYSDLPMTLEVYSLGRAVGTLLTDPSPSLPEVDIEDIKLEDLGEYIYFSFRRVGDLYYCSLELSSEDVRVLVDRIPPERSYLKIRKLWEKEDEEIWDYSITCFTADGRGYVRRESVRGAEEIAVLF